MRSALSSGGGTRYGIPASRIFARARTSLFDMVASETRNARAISPVVSPATVRNVKATLASSGRAGWQQVKISRNLSSSAPDHRWPVLPGPSSWAMIASSRTALFSLAALRMRSIALFLATVVSHAPGFLGTPCSGQSTKALANASWTQSSARLQSPVTRMRVAVMRAVSSAEAASTAVRASVSSWCHVIPPTIIDAGHRANHYSPSGHTGLISILPNRAMGCLDATSIASSRSAHAMMS